MDSFTGKTLRKQANFSAAAFNPNVRVLDRAVARLEKDRAWCRYFISGRFIQKKSYIEIYEAKHI